ncbi:MAG: sugar-binding protein, partial [Eubacterium sp.]|nr:sugar-binding protein [Eubacterium sp.]
MRAKKLLAVMLSAVLAFSLVACGEDKGTTDNASTDNAATEESSSDSGETADAPASAGGNKVGIAMPTKSLERWNRDGSYLEEQFKSKGYEVSLTYSDNKIDQQVKDIEGLIADNVNLLVVAAIDGESLSQVLAQAKEQGIPVISYDRLIMNTDAISYYVSFDNYTVGKLQGEFVRDQLDLDNAAGPFNIEFTAGDPADNNAGFFFNGAKDALQKYLDEGKLVVQSGQTEFDQVATQQWDTSKALTRFQN